MLRWQNVPHHADLSRSAQRYVRVCRGIPIDQSRPDPSNRFGLLFGQALRPKGFAKTHSCRIYVATKLYLPRWSKRRTPDRFRAAFQTIHVQTNCTSSADSAANALWLGRRLRAFKFNDNFDCESLRIELKTRLPPLRAIRALDELGELRGAIYACAWIMARSSSSARCGSGPGGTVSTHQIYFYADRKTVRKAYQRKLKRGTLGVEVIGPAA